MKAHHKAWLAAHPERTEAWLEQALEQGFDVHHLNGWLSNEEIEKRLGNTLAKGEKAYRLKVQFPSKTWKQIGEELGYSDKRIVMKTIAIAKQWAIYHGQKWPLGKLK